MLPGPSIAGLNVNTCCCAQLPASHSQPLFPYTETTPHLPSCRCPQVRQAFGTLQDPSWVVVDAARSVETVQAEIAEESERILSRCEAGVPLGTLWPSA